MTGSMPSSQNGREAHYASNDVDRGIAGSAIWNFCPGWMPGGTATCTWTPSCVVTMIRPPEGTPGPGYFEWLKERLEGTDLFYVRESAAYPTA